MNLYRSTEYAKSYNISGKDEPLTVFNLISLMLSALQKELQIIVENSHLHEAQLLQLDSSLIAKDIGFENKFDNNQAIKQTALWYLEYLQQSDVKNLTDCQIQNYFNL
jgi:CDP-glucose 4,6-dehydratase